MRKLPGVFPRARLAIPLFPRFVPRNGIEVFPLFLPIPDSIPFFPFLPCFRTLRVPRAPGGRQTFKVRNINPIKSELNGKWGMKNPSSFLSSFSWRAAFLSLHPSPRLIDRLLYNLLSFSIR